MTDDDQIALPQPDPKADQGNPGRRCADARMRGTGEAASVGGLQDAASGLTSGDQQANGGARRPDRNRLPTALHDTMGGQSANDGNPGEPGSGQLRASHHTGDDGATGTRRPTAADAGSEQGGGCSDQRVNSGRATRESDRTVPGEARGTGIGRAAAADQDQVAPIDPSGIDWRDGAIPVSRRFDDPYFSLNGGLAETRHVFLDGNDLPTRLRPGFHVAETGFGTGLNLLALAQIATVPIRFTSFEAYPLTVADLIRAHTAFPELAPLAAELRAGWSAIRSAGRVKVGLVEVELILGDARATLPRWTGCADAWFLDGFSPAKNPELWSDALMAHIASHTAPKGSFATYTAAGHVRRALAAGGFEVERAPGFAGKRHMSRGRLA